MSLFKTNTTGNYSKPTRSNNMYRSRKKPRKQSQDNMIKAIEDRIIRDIKKLFEQDEYYYKPVRLCNFYSNYYVEYENNGDRTRTLLIKEYLDEIKPYLKDIINSLKKSDTRKIQLTMGINFISSKDTDEERVMHSKSDYIEIMIYDKADEVIQEHFDLLFSRYQTGLEKSMIGSDFIFDCLIFLHYKCHKVSLKRCGSNIDSPDWTRNTKATKSPINNDEKYIHYAVTVALNHKEIGKNSQRISNIQPVTQIFITGKE